MSLNVTQLVLVSVIAAVPIGLNQREVPPSTVGLAAATDQKSTEIESYSTESPRTQKSRQASGIVGHTPSGGGASNVGGLTLVSSFGQLAVGVSEIPGHTVESGFLTGIGGCCIMRGDVQHSGSINLSDIVYLIDSMFRGGPDPPCMEEADVDGNGSLNVSDLTYLIDSVFRGGPDPAPCD
jgi:hypothetical protein